MKWIDIKDQQLPSKTGPILVKLGSPLCIHKTYNMDHSIVYYELRDYGGQDHESWEVNDDYGTSFDKGGKMWGEKIFVTHWFDLTEN